MIPPPITFPIVTGSRLSRRNPSHVRLVSWGRPDVFWIQASSVLIRSASGMKYMFATECSNPSATNAAIGGTTARILSVVVWAPYVSQTARQTSALQSAPSAIACPKPRFVLLAPIVSAVTPTEPPPKVYSLARKTRIAVPTAPTKLPTYTIDQFRRSDAVLIRLLPHAITI